MEILIDLIQTRFFKAFRNIRKLITNKLIYAHNIHDYFISIKKYLNK